MVGQKSGRTCHVNFLVVNVLQLCLDVLFFITSCCVDFGVFVCNVSWPSVLLKSALVVVLASRGVDICVGGFSGHVGCSERIGAPHIHGTSFASRLASCLLLCSRSLTLHF